MTTTDDIRERVSRLEGGYEHLATKADLAKLEARMETRFAQMDARFEQMETRMDARFAQMENRLLLKFGGLVIATVGVAVAVLRLLG
jgi:flagellar capping protein FliD